MQLDRNTQRRVWARVYGSPARPKPRQGLENARRRERANLQFFQSGTSDPVYGPAYAHLAALARQILAMLDRMP